MSEQDISWQRFLAAQGRLFTTFESQKILDAKLEDDTAFIRFKQNAASADAAFFLFPHLDKHTLSTCSIPATFTGEWLSRLQLGSGVHIGDDVNILAHGGITIKNDVTIGKDVQMITAGHGLHPSQRFLLRCTPIVIEEGAKIGEGCIIVNASVDGTPLVIGKNAVILPHSIVVKNVADNETVAGRPAKPITALHEGGNLTPYWNASAQKGTEGCHKISTPEEAHDHFPTLRTILPLYFYKPENVNVIGNNCFLNRNTIIRAHGVVELGNNALIAPACTLHVEEGGRLVIEDDVWIGAGARIDVAAGKTLCIGKGSIIAAGAHITESVEELSVMTGHNKHVKKLTDEHREPVPERWDDAAYVQTARQQAHAWNRQARQQRGF